MSASTAPPLPPFDFLGSIAAQLFRERGPHAADARRLLRLLRLRRHLLGEAESADGQLAAGLAANLLPLIQAAAGRLEL